EDPADAACFAYSNFGRITNICATSRIAIFPLTIETSGAKTIQIVARSSNPSNNVCCTARGTSASGESQWGSNTGCLPAFGSAQTIPLNGASVPSQGAAYAYCNMGPNTFVSSVSISPP